MAPELAVQQELLADDSLEGIGAAPTLTEVYLQRLRTPHANPQLDKVLVGQVLDQARRIVAHPSKPLLIERVPFWENPFHELSLEETLEDNPLLTHEAPIWVEQARAKPFFCSAMLDCSASMSGEKHLLGAIAVAVLLLEMRSEDSSVVVFSSQAKCVKAIAQAEPLRKTLLNFLAVKPRGFTNIYSALEEGLVQCRRARGARRKVGLIATDGRSTEGGDPIAMAKQYDCLVVLHLHGSGSHIQTSRDLAHAGNGFCLEVEEMAELPRRMYDAIRMIARL